MVTSFAEKEVKTMGIRPFPKMLEMKRKGRKSAAIVKISINGKQKTFYLGPWGSQEADQKYRELAKEYYAGNLCQNEEVSKAVLNGTTIDVVYNQFLSMLENRPESSDKRNYKAALWYAAQAMPNFRCDEISPLHLARFQDYLVSIANEVAEEVRAEDGMLIQRKKGKWSRQYCNKLFNFYKTVLRFGVNKGLIPYQFLAVINGFHAIPLNDTLTEKESVEDVPDDVVIATLPFLAPQIADMVKLIRGACMRPSELCRLKVGDLDQTGKKWKCKIKGKTSRFGFDRFIAFSQSETEILKKRVEGKTDEQFVFSPKEAMQELWATLEQGDKERDNARLDRYGDCWTTEGISHAITRGIRKAKKAGVEIPHWTAYQLRHAAYTKNAAQYGIEVASKIAGHSSIDMSKVYDHSLAKVATDNAAKREAWWEE